jgi:N-acetylglucosamine transport system permease protein
MRSKSKLGRLPYGFLAVCVLPALVLTIVFVVIPTLNALFMSLTNASSMRMSASNRFVWFDNYRYMFTKDKNFGVAAVNTLKLLAVVPAVTVFLALVLAFLLTQTKLRERGAYRVLFFLPSVISMAVVGIVWACIFDPRSGGVANQLLAVFGGRSVPWLGDKRYALWCIAFTLVWQATGYYMVMHVAAIDSISQDIYEAAAIDGATQAGKFFRITVPLLRDTIGITFVLAMSGTINLSYTLSTIMTGGGPGNHSLVLLQYMYRMAFGSSANFGYAMTVTVFSLALAFLLSTLSRKLSYRNENA